MTDSTENQKQVNALKDFRKFARRLRYHDRDAVGSEAANAIRANFVELAIDGIMGGGNAFVSSASQFWKENGTTQTDSTSAAEDEKTGRERALIETGWYFYQIASMQRDPHHKWRSVITRDTVFPDVKVGKRTIAPSLADSDLSMIKRRIEDEIRQRLIDEVCDRMIDHKRADRIAKVYALDPIQCRASREKHDPRRKSHWTLPMAIVFAATGKPDDAMMQDDAYRAECRQWGSRGGQPELEALSRVTVDRLVQSGAVSFDDDWIPTGALADAKEMLWDKLKADALRANAIDVTGIPREIATTEWFRLHATDDGSRIALAYGERGPIAFRDPLFPREKLVELFGKSSPAAVVEQKTKGKSRFSDTELFSLYETHCQKQYKETRRWLGREAARKWAKNLKFPLLQKQIDKIHALHAAKYSRSGGRPSQ